MLDALPNLHPILVHFSLGLLATSSVLFLCQPVLPASTCQQHILITARCTLWLGCFITLGTLMTGWLAYNSVPHDADTFAFMTIHRYWALATATLFFLLGAWQFVKETVTPAYLLATALALVLLVVTGYKGTELVFRYGVGVQSLQKTSFLQHRSNDGKHSITIDTEKLENQLNQLMSSWKAETSEPQ